jgi:cyclohexa-1,5-dienecarbonyl-CoA hydratase
MTDLVRVTQIDDGACWRVTFGAAKGNVLDIPMIAALDRVFMDAASADGLRAVCLEGAGSHFSFGASVQDHLPDRVRDMLQDFHRLALHVLDSRVVVMAAVRGQCLGGGLELASLCHRVFAAPDARFGQPEIALGVFPPIASLVLPERIGRARAEDLCLTGRVVTAAEAHAMGLVDELIDGDPAEAALSWARKHFAMRSTSSLRLAVQAIRADLSTRLQEQLPAIEALYLTELMATHDAHEGLHAFLDKRPPVWRHA